MIHLSRPQTTARGFTITELLVSIVVIGILASMVIVLWSGYQQRGRDAERKSDVQQIKAAFGAYALQKNNYVGSGSGCGLNGNGNGWFNAGPSESGAGNYPKPIATCLKEAKVIGESVLSDPSQCLWDSGGKCGTYRGNPVQAYMKVSCLKNGKAMSYIMAYIESEPRKDSEVDALCDSGTVDGFNATTQLWGTNYGMNYYVVIK